MGAHCILPGPGVNGNHGYDVDDEVAPKVMERNSPMRFDNGRDALSIRCAIRYEEVEDEDNEDLEGENGDQAKKKGGSKKIIIIVFL